MPILSENAVIGLLAADQVATVYEMVAAVFPNGAFQRAQILASICGFVDEKKAEGINGAMLAIRALIADFMNDIDSKDGD